MPDERTRTKPAFGQAALQQLGGLGVDIGRRGQDPGEPRDTAHGLRDQGRPQRDGLGRGDSVVPA